MNRCWYRKTKNSAKIADASFIGLECESGDVDDCNDLTERAPASCRGVLILSEKESKCGSKCNASSNKKSTRSFQFRKDEEEDEESHNRWRWWTLWTRKANTILINITYIISEIEPYGC